MHSTIDNNRHSCILQWLVYLFIYVCIYGYAMFRFGMDYDEVNCFGMGLNDEYLIIGRWGLYLYRYVMGGGTAPFVAGLIAAFYLSYALVLQTRMLELRKVWQQVLYGVMYLGCLQWMFQLRYAVQTDAVALSFLLMTFSALLLQEKGIAKLVLSCALLCFSLSIYQSNGLYWVALLMVFGIKSTIRDNKLPSFRWCIKAAGITIVAVLLYSLISKLVVQYANVPEEFKMKLLGTVDARTPYWIHQSENTFQILQAFGHYTITVPIKRFIMGNGQYHGHWVCYTALLPITYLLYYVWRHCSWKLSIVLTPFIISLPFIPYETLRSFPTRVYVAEPLVLASAWGLALTVYKPTEKSALKALLSCLCAFVFVKSMYRASIMAADEAYYFQTSAEEFQNMNERGRQVGIQAGYYDCPIIILGSVEHPSGELYTMEQNGKYENQASPCLLYWDVETYAEFLRYPRLKQGSKEDIERHAEAYAQMPSWPSDQSVRADKGEVIIRID